MPRQVAFQAAIADPIGIAREIIFVQSRFNSAGHVSFILEHLHEQISQLPVLFRSPGGRARPSRGRAHEVGARPNTLASLRGNIERVEAHGERTSRNGWRSGIPRRTRSCRVVSLWGRCTRCSPRPAGMRRGNRSLSPGLAGGRRAAAVGVGEAGFYRDGIGRVVDERRAELGLDPRLLVTCARRMWTALRTAADALACDALGVVVLEVWGEARQFDLVASRKLTLAAQTSGATALLLRMAAVPQPSTAETRWIVRAAHSPPATARKRVGRTCIRRAACPQPSWPCRPVDHGIGNVMSAFSRNRRRILSLWLPRLPIDRSRRRKTQEAAGIP